jgi:hypothetical protein
MDTLEKLEKIEKILQRVSKGAWHSEYPSLFDEITQCVFCYVSPESEHSECCPVRMAKEVLEG